MKIAVCPGSFDPPTAGHLDVIKRAAALFDRVYVAILHNSSKRAAFSPEERVSLMERAVAAAGLSNVTVEAYDGLTVDFAAKAGAQAMVRGIRGPEDLQYEQGLEAANKYLHDRVETVYLTARPELAFISSSMVKEIGAYGRDIDGLVPEVIKNTIAERLIKR